MFSLVVLLLATHSNAQAPPSVSIVPATSADGASQVIDPSFAGMGIEPSNLFSFTGGSEPNQLSINLLNNLANYTGAAPHLRIGGNTEDNLIWDPNFSQFSIHQNPQPTGQGNVPSDLFSFGPNFFKALDRFPRNTPITFGLNLAYDNSDYIQNIVNEAEAARTMLQNVRLKSFEIGNEPDLYLQNMFRNGSWDGTAYTSDWLARANAVYQQVLKPNNISADFFEPGCTASTIGTSFQIDLLVQDGIAAPVNGTPNNVNESLIATWNQHDYYYYIGVSAYDLTTDMLLQLNTTGSQFMAWTAQIQQAFDSGQPYALREMASVGPIGQQGISDVFAATLWQLNFFLYAASLNISSVQMHMTDNSWAAPWQPISMYGSGPHVRSPYYAWAAMDQLIGGGCTTQVGNITIDTFPDSYESRLAAYATYQQGTLAAMVFLNTQPANASAPKGSVTFDVSLPDYQGQTLFLSYLTADGSDSTQNTTWNGISFEQNGIGMPTVVNKTVQSVPIDSNGQASIAVRDSQAVVAALGQQIGTGPPSHFNKTACAGLADSVTVPSPSEQSSAAAVSSSSGSDGSKPSSTSANNASTATEHSLASSFVRPSFLSTIASIMMGLVILEVLA